MNGSELKRVYIYSIYPRGSMIPTNNGIVNIDDGITGGSHWTCFYKKTNHSILITLVANLIGL